jgi:head-tail adaptor
MAFPSRRAASLGSLREVLLIQTPSPAVLAVATLTRVSTTATATTAAAHGYATGDYVTIAGASPAGYTGKVKITVTGTTTFTYTVSDALTTPATGTITVTYASDAQGGRRISWSTLDTVRGELIPIRATERLQAQAIGSQVETRFRVHARADVTPSMRVVWTPSWPSGSAAQTLEILGVQPEGDGRLFMLLDCGQVT